MLFNFKKCKVLHVGRNNPNVQYVMDGIPLENVTEEKDLGMTVTESLNLANNAVLQLLKPTEYLGN